MRGSNAKEETKGRKHILAGSGQQEAYYYVKDASGHITWYVAGDMALSAWDQAGGDGKVALYCGRKPNAMTRIR